MKRILVSLIMVATMIALLVAPALVVAEEIPITTNVTISTGGDPPIVKCKWEQEPATVNCTTPESGDPTHAENGTQINPPMLKCDTKPIQYYAVVTDPQGVAAVTHVFADVFHPADSPYPYNDSDDLKGPLFKYEIGFHFVSTFDDAEDLVREAYDAGLIKFGAGYDLAEVIRELDKGEAEIWMGEEDIDYEQPGGMYDVNVYAIDLTNNLSEALSNQFCYVPTCGIEVDFDSIHYGSVDLGVEKLISGDTEWSVSAPQPAGANQTNGATVRNIGNTWTSLIISQDDMGFGQEEGVWNVFYDTRMGSDDTFYVQYEPEQTVTLVNALGLSKRDELDFSIKVMKPSIWSSYNGTMTLCCEIRNFAYNSSCIVGIPDECV